MSQRAKKKPNKGVVATTIVVAIILTVVLFPRRNCLLDGGTVIYRSIAFERLYQVEHRHRLYDEAGYVYYEKGYTKADIAREKGISESMVKKLFQRGQDILREQMIEIDKNDKDIFKP